MHFLSYALCILLLLACNSPQAEINIYTSRASHLIVPLFKKFEANSGIKVNYINDKAGPLIERIRIEGKNTHADLLITVDAGNLWHAANFGLLRPIQDKSILQNIPKHLRDENNQWVALSKRVRAIVYSTDRVKADSLSSYQDLAEEKWKGKLCLRTSKKVYNQSLIASFIAHFGPEQTEATVKGWVRNLAQPPFSSDTKAIKAILTGECDVTIVNSYYYLRLIENNPELPIKLFWPNQNTTGVHVNISGAGITKYAKNVKEATQFLAWLTSTEAQYELALLNKEIPVNIKAKTSVLVGKSMQGLSKEDSLNVSILGRLQSQSIKLMDRSGYR